MGPEMFRMIGCPHPSTLFSSYPIKVDKFHRIVSIPTSDSNQFLLVKSTIQLLISQFYGSIPIFQPFFPYGSVSKRCTPSVHIQIAGIYGCSSP